VPRPDDVARLLTGVLERFARIDGLVAAAGVAH
jgi:NAD(P)-dependent dehydrogenase (short-subunit alcohol dehydrogenase family)